MSPNASPRAIAGQGQPTADADIDTSSPDAPISMIPRTKARRRSSRKGDPVAAGPQSTMAADASSSSTTSPASSRRATPDQPSSTASSLTTSTTISATPLATPSSSPNAPHAPAAHVRQSSLDGQSDPNPISGSISAPAAVVGPGAAVINNASSTSLRGLAKGRPAINGASTASIVGLGMTAGTATGSSTPQTGVGKMAAAAKRGHQGGAVDNLPPVNDDGQEDEDHPLSERSLGARDYQTIRSQNRLFHLPNRWKLIRPLGQGAYGLVISVQDSLSGEPVAVKCITKVFDKVILARRALREITLLRHFGGHENLTGLIDLDHVWDGYNEIYLYMEPMEADLHQIVRSGQALSNSHIQYFLYQLLRGMKYVHSANVIHRDLKPGNLLVNADCELKICDFGLARGFKPATGQGDQNEELKLTEYVATRWYRAPEVMLSNRRYTTAIDVWSIGCILAELLGGKPIFKGKDYVDQLNLILGVLGTPGDETLFRVGSEKAAQYIKSLPRSDPVPLQLILPDADPQALDLLSCLLAFDPDERVDVATALTHAYVAPYHDPADEPSCPEVFEKWEQVEALQTIPELREAITREIKEFREEVRSIEIDDGQEDIPLEAIIASPETVSKGLFPHQGSYSEFGGSPSAQSYGSLSSSRDVSVQNSPLNQNASLPRSSSLDRRPQPQPPLQPQSQSQTRDSGPSTPLTAISAFSEDSFSTSAPASSHDLHGGRHSRRSSSHSIRHPASFLFSNPLGAGMTPMNHSASLPAAAGAGLSGTLTGATANVGPLHPSQPGSASQDDGWARPRSRSRAPSSSGEFAIRPLMRQLSTVGLESLARDGSPVSELQSHAPSSHGHAPQSGLVLGLSGTNDPPGIEQVPPMQVSPSDAPPSEAPRAFPNPPLSVPTPLVGTPQLDADHA